MFSGPMRIYYFAGAALLLAGILFVVTRSSVPDHPDPEIAKIDRMERKRDVQGLTESLKSPREDIACRAIVALAHVSGKAARPALEGLFADSRVSVRSTAADQFAIISDRGDIAPLLPVFKSEKDPKAKAAIAAALGQNQGWEAMTVLVPALDDPNSTVRKAAAHAILRITGLKPGIYDKSTQADRRRTIDQLNASLPTMKSQYENYWASQPVKEKK